MAIKKVSQQAKVKKNEVEQFIEKADLKDCVVEKNRNYKQVCFRLNKQEYDLLENKAKELRRTVADTIRIIVIDTINS